MFVEAKSLGWIFDSVGNVTIPVKKVLLSYANSDIHKMESRMICFLFFVLKNCL